MTYSSPPMMVSTTATTPAAKFKFTITSTSLFMATPFTPTFATIFPPTFAFSHTFTTPTPTAPISMAIPSVNATSPTIPATVILITPSLSTITPNFRSGSLSTTTVTTSNPNLSNATCIFTTPILATLISTFNNNTIHTLTSPTALSPNASILSAHTPSSTSTPIFHAHNLNATTPTLPTVIVFTPNLDIPTTATTSTLTPNTPTLTAVTHSTLSIIPTTTQTTSLTPISDTHISGTPLVHTQSLTSVTATSTFTSASTPASRSAPISTTTQLLSMPAAATTSVSISINKLTKATSIAPKYPLSEMEEVVVSVIQSLGCTFILISLGVTLVTYWILHDWSYERFLHMNQEIALFLAHILILFLRDRVDMQIPCKLTAIGLQFFYTAVFAFLALEALQTYAIRTNVILSDGYFTRMQFFVIGWCGPGVITVISSVTNHSEYVSIWSCWMNLKSNISMATMGPVVVLAALAIIMAEAAGMGNYKPLPRTNKHQATAAVANQKALFLIVPLNTAAWFTGLYAVFYVNITLYSLVAALNISLGVSIFVFHTLGNPKVHAIFKQMFRKICGRK